MSGKVLLDTSIVVEMLANRVLGELYYGAWRSGRGASALRRVQDFARGGRVLDCDEETAKRYGELRQELALRGRPIPENDLWIAATARRHGLPLATKDGHFREVSGLELVSY